MIRYLNITLRKFVKMAEFESKMRLLSSVRSLILLYVQFGTANLNISVMMRCVLLVGPDLFQKHCVHVCYVYSKFYF